MPISPTVILGIVELGKLGLQTWMQAMRMAGKTEEEIDQMYEIEKASFLAIHPSTLPDVPEDVPEEPIEVQ